MLPPSSDDRKLAGVAGQPSSFGAFAPGPLPGLLWSPVGIAFSGTSLYIACSEAVAVVQNLLAVVQNLP